MALTVDVHTLVLVGVAIYFGLGGLFASAMAAVSYGFTGRGDPMIAVVFFAWPFILLARIPGIVFIAAGIGAAGTATLIAWVILRSL